MDSMSSPRLVIVDELPLNIFEGSQKVAKLTNLKSKKNFRTIVTSGYLNILKYTNLLGSGRYIKKQDTKFQPGWDIPVDMGI